MAKLVIDEEVSNAWGRLTSDNSDVSWIAAGYPEGNSLQISFKGEGTGGLPEFLSSLPENDIVWGAFKVVAVDDRGNLVSRRPKFISVKYCPATGIAPMKRAKAGGHKGAVKQIMSSHVDIEVESLEELSEEAIIAKLRACGGAHQPTGYEFHSYSGGNIPSPVRSTNASPVPPSAPAPAPVVTKPAATTPTPEPVSVSVSVPEESAPTTEPTAEVVVEEVPASVAAEEEVVVEEEQPQKEEDEVVESAAEVEQLADSTAELDVNNE